MKEPRISTDAGSKRKSTQVIAMGLGLAAILLIVLALVIWRFPPSGPPGMRGAPQEIQRTNQAVPAEPKRRSRSRAVGNATKAFPIADDIPAGMTKAELLQRFGKPNMISTAVEHGHVVETLLYIRRGVPTTETVVISKDGTVVAASTTNR